MARTPRTRSAPRAAAAVLATLLALLSWPARADKPRLHLTDIDTTSYPTVRAHLSLVESDGRLVTGRSAADFKLLVDGTEQGAALELQPFDATGEPVFVVIVVQVSGAMHDAMDEIRRGVREIAGAVASLHAPASRVALLSYSQEIGRVAELGRPEAIEGAASRLVEDTAGTEVHLVEAVRTALDLLDGKAVPEGARRLLVLLGDGIDAQGADRRTFADLGRRANLSGAPSRRGVVIHTVGYAPFDRSRLRHLGELSRQTNGTERACRSPQDVAPQLFSVADEIRKQYRATFQAVLALGNGNHDFQVLAESNGVPIWSEMLGAPVVPATRKETTPPLWLFLLCGCGAVVALVLAGSLLARRRRPVPMADAQWPTPANDEPRHGTLVSDPSPWRSDPIVAWLVGLGGRYADTTFRLRPARTVVGAAVQSDIRLDDPRVSRRHCEIVCDGSSFRIIDLDSANGVLLNDRRTRTAELVDGDVLCLGGVVLKFKSIN